MIVIKVDKEMTTDECLEHANKLSMFYGERVIVLDKKVIDIDFINETDEYYWNR